MRRSLSNKYTVPTAWPAPPASPRLALRATAGAVVFAMYHTIEFVIDCTVNLETSPKQRLQKLRIRRGDRRRARLRPYVVETALGPTEVADLVFEDGTATRMVGFWRFALVD